MSSHKKPSTWLITGSSNGLGLALTRHVLASGDNVIATARNPAKTPDLMKEIESQQNGKWLSLDVTWSREKIDEVVKTAETYFGKAGIDVVVNNAAFSVLGAVEDIPEEQAKAEL